MREMRCGVDWGEEKDEERCGSVMDTFWDRYANVMIEEKRLRGCLKVSVFAKDKICERLKRKRGQSAAKSIVNELEVWGCNIII
jgi:hypothetical protein